jgi:hypothetical protein
MAYRASNGILLFTAIVGLAGVASSQGLQVQGAFIADIGGVMYKVDVATTVQTRLFSGDDLVGHYGPLRRPTFSPDGRRIAFTCENNVPTTREIWVADNNGANRTKLCDYYNSSAGTDNVNWCTDGYIYWAEQSNAIYRVNVLTRQREIAWDQPNITGYHTPDLYVEDMTISSDGHYGSSRGSGRVSAFDLVGKQILSYGQGGCSGWMSGGGTRIVHPYTCCVTFPAGATTYLAVAAVESVTVTVPPGEQLSPRPVIQFLWSPGQPNGVDANRAEDFRFAKNSDDYVVAHGRENNSALGALIYFIPTAAYESVPLTNWGEVNLWIGQLPSPPAPGPHIVLSDTALALNAARLRDTVDVTNSAVGTLGTLTITNTASWLTVTPGGSGNAQRLILTASASGLTAGTYRVNVAVSGGGADNAPTVAVTFTVGSTLTAPSAATATKGVLDAVTVGWTDNSATESGFAVERSSGVAFAEVGRVAANAVSFLDTTARATPGTYSYRIRAFDATSYSGYSDTAQVTISAASSVTVTYPNAGATVQAGSTVRITWTAVNLTAVVIDFSPDDGDHWYRITSSAAVFATDSLWGNFPWHVADTLAGSGLIRISDYNHGPAEATSPPFTITPSTAVAGRVSCAALQIGIVSAVSMRGTVEVHARVGAADGWVEMALVGLNGQVIRRAVAQTDGRGEVAASMGAPPRSLALVRVSAQGRSWTARLAP